MLHKTGSIGISNQIDRIREAYNLMLDAPNERRYEILYERWQTSIDALERKLETNRYLTGKEKPAEIPPQAKASGFLSVN